MSTVTPDIRLLKNFSPFDLVSDNSLTEILTNTRLVNKPAGTMLFKRGEERSVCHWLVKGSIDLVDKTFSATQITTGHKVMLDEGESYEVTGVTIEESLLLEMESNALDIVLTVDQAKDDDEDWMTRLLRSRLFELIPPANIQELFNRFSPVNFNRGDVVIREGDEGDYFYVVKEGRLKIERDNDGQPQLLAEVGPGACFGEDALLEGKPRNATITMQSQGVLMKLTKADFNNLLAKPACEYVSLEEVEAVIAGGEQKVELIDVRYEEEINGDLHPNSHNIPLKILREAMRTLDSETVYVITTAGRRGELAAFLMTQAGFDAYLLEH